MTVQLLRWPSGSGGDTVLKILLDSNSELQSNIKFKELTESGRTTTEFTELITQYPELANLSGRMSDYEDKETLNRITETLKKLSAEKTDYIFRCHGFIPEFEKFDIIDIKPTKTYFSFIIQSHMAKRMFRSENDGVNNLHIHLRHNDKYQQESLDYETYCVAVQHLKNIEQARSPNCLLVDTLLSNWINLKYKLSDLGFTVRDQCKPYYTSWLDQNTNYISSPKYRYYIGTQDYNYHDTSLNRIERYCLLALTGDHFQILN
jgi:hypothetical protein